jgi:tRNA U34 5-carboxymethylaminomethyl modifying GTPase MnmE/TrmE
MRSTANLNLSDTTVRGASRASQVPDAGPLEEQLERIERFLRRLDGSALAAAGAVGELRQRLAEGRLHLAVLGQFKRGKSTLLNALVGEELLPTAVVPLTAVPTFLRFGDAPALRVSYADGRPAERHQGGSIDEVQQKLAGLVTETGNPKNHLGISQVEAFLPSPLLARGVVLVDTPGIGSTLRHNTEATMSFLPQCDAALFVLSADPPITDAEAQFLKAVRDKVRRLFFLLNKVDYLNAGELEQAREFVAAVLAEKAGMDRSAPLFCTSARWGLEARRNDDPRRWEESGLKAVEERLVSFLAEEKHKTLAEAVGARAWAATEEAALGLELAVRSWQISLEELERKAAQFAAKAEELHREADRSEDLLNGDQQRLQQKLEDHAEALRSRARNFLSETLERQASQAGELSEQQLQASLAEAVPEFFEHEMTVMVDGFKKELNRVMEPHRRRAAELVGILQATAAELFEVPLSALGAEETLQSFKEPSWVIHSWNTALHPIPPGLIDQLLSPSRRKARLLRRLAELVEELVVGNVEKLRWSVLQSLVQAFLINKPLVQERLTQLLEATQEAVQRTLQKRRTLQQSSSPELERLAEQLRELRRLQAGLRQSLGSLDRPG